MVIHHGCPLMVDPEHGGTVAAKPEQATWFFAAGVEDKSFVEK